MSLQFIIDGYNIIHHPAFAPQINKCAGFTRSASKKIRDSKAALLEFISKKKPCGSSKNKVCVVFDGYPHPQAVLNGYPAIEVVFSGRESADERIKKRVEFSSRPKNIVVVSDDKEIKFLIKSLGSRSLSVEEFMGVDRREKTGAGKKDILDFELTYTQRHKINEELKKIWLE